MTPFFLVAYLLATTGGGGGRGRSTSRSPNSSGRGRGRGRGRGGGGGGGAASTTGRGGGVGRNRYTRDGIKKRSSNPSNEDFGDSSSSKQEELYPLPPLTVPNGPRPSYFTCRHNYENTLIDEIQRYARIISDDDGKVVVKASSPYPGLVRVEDDDDYEDAVLPSLYDPVYALQTMPECVVVTAESIKGIAREVIAALLGNNERNHGDDDDDGTISIVDEKSKALREKFRTAQRGSLTIHPLVPGMCKGQSNPLRLHRSVKIGEEISKMLKKSYPAARKAPPTNQGADDENSSALPKERWVLQMMLQSPNIAVACLTQCHHVGPGNNAYWPNALHPLGLAKVDIIEKMPSSAYRKLMEGIECMGVRPSSTTASSSSSSSSSSSLTTVVDLGACPGGWTAVVRRCFDDSRVIAVDRTVVDSSLMKDGMVDFVKGDAFAFEPPERTLAEGGGSGSGSGSSSGSTSNDNNNNNDLWMISDVIAYPERATELMSKWCEMKWASHMIVTMKFQGKEPDLEELDRAIDIVRNLGYDCRVKHFFNNKNEVTFMVSEKKTKNGVMGKVRNNDLEVGIVGTSMFSTL